MTNQQIAQQLREHAAELARRGDNLYRVRAFRRAAMTVLGMDRPIEEFVASRGCHGLTVLPGIGSSLAETIAGFATRGAWEPRSPANRMARCMGRAEGSESVIAPRRR